MAKKFTLTIETGNAAFEDGNRPVEIARILRLVCKRLTEGTLPAAGDLFDINGNKVGTFTGG